MMRLTLASSVLILGILAPVAASAQATTATISGRVTDQQELPLPGVTVTATSPNLQGSRVTTTSMNGDYIISLLPPGTYTVTFEIGGFQRVQQSVNVAPTQVRPLDVTLGPSGVTETVEVTGQSADVLTQTAQVATNFGQDLIAALPTTRDINAALLLAPSVHATGPSGNYSIAGAMSYENLFMINGVTINENLRGQPNALYIEDAIQETTVATGGISAEYGRFGGGVVNVITKSGGNRFSGSFRDTLHNDRWRTLVPAREGDVFTGETGTSRLDQIVPTYEYTFGGPILRDRIWFFTAGRLQTQESGRTLVQTQIPYTFTDKSRRYEFNGTYSPAPAHRIQGMVIRETRDQLNNTFSTAASMDLRSLENRSLPQDMVAFTYSGSITPRLFIEGRYSRRNYTFSGSGATSTDIIDGTLLTDQARGGLRYWSATFCGVCSDEERDNDNLFVKGTYFLSTAGAGSHTLTFGYDHFNDRRLANNHQSGSDYRILGTTSIIDGTDIWPVFQGNGTTIIQWNPIPLRSAGANFRQHALFINDSWRVNRFLTANIGLRWSKNDGKNQEGERVMRDSALSPRFGVVWDPTGTGSWSVTASTARYVAAVSTSISDSSSAAGNPQTWRYVYSGPDINANGPVTSSAEAIQQVFNWFQAAGGCVPQDNSCRPNLPTDGNPSIPGVATLIGDNLTTPSTYEYAFGVNRQFGARAAVRADYVFRDYNDFYVTRRDLSTGVVTNEVGQRFDLGLIENSNIYERRYHGVTMQGTYRFGTRLDTGATYTLSRAWGNLDGENVASGPVTGGALSYPEYIAESWNYPTGDLAHDQRHRVRLWLNYGVPRVDGLMVSVLQTVESGLPYGAGGIPIQGGNNNGANPQPYVADLGYITPPTGSITAYFYTARDAFRTEGQRRTDLAVNYTRDVNAGGQRIGLFVQAQVVNLFNQFQRCGCGASVFSNGGAAQLQTIDRTARTPVTHPAIYAAFDPFTTEPNQGVNWDYGPNFGGALNRFAYTTPRMFRVTFGARF